MTVKHYEQQSVNFRGHGSNAVGEALSEVEGLIIPASIKVF